MLYLILKMSRKLRQVKHGIIGGIKVEFVNKEKFG